MPAGFGRFSSTGRIRRKKFLDFRKFRFFPVLRVLSRRFILAFSFIFCKQKRTQNICTSNKLDVKTRIAFLFYFQKTCYARFENMTFVRFRRLNVVFLGADFIFSFILFLFFRSFYFAISATYFARFPKTENASYAASFTFLFSRTL